MLLATLGALVVAQFSSASDPRRTFAAGGKDAFLMLPPETVCGAEASEMVWTADGSALAVLRNVVDLRPADLVLIAGGARPTPDLVARLRPRTELVLWSVASRKARVVARTDAAQATIGELRPMPRSDRIVVRSTSAWTRPDGSSGQTLTIGLLAAGTGTIVPLDVSEGHAPTGFDVSTTRPLGILTRFDPAREDSVGQLFGPSGRVGPAIALPQRAHMAFDRDGLPGYVVVGRREGKRTATFHRLDPATGRETAVVPYTAPIEAPPGEAPSAPGPLSVRVVAGASAGAAAPSLFLSVQGGKPEEAGVVSTDGVRGTLSPRNDAVAYVSQGSAMVRLLAKVPRKAFDDARLAALKSVALSDAKQAAVALLIFSADNDDDLPGPGEYEKILPYLKDRRILDAFTYTFGGGKQTEIENPAGTEIGYVSGPGGRAVAYADGHVRWVPDAP